MEGNKDEAIKCTQNARKSMRGKDMTAAKKHLQKSIRLCDTEEAQDLLTNITQEEAVKRVMNSRDYYEIFGVSIDATRQEIKEAYKQLVLQVHPDKNKHTGSEEAFIRMGAAYNNLMDPDKRRQHNEQICDVLRRNFVLNGE